MVSYRVTVPISIPLIVALQHRQDTCPDKLSLFGLMVKPVQRFPQIILQLQVRGKQVPFSHSGVCSMNGTHVKNFDLFTLGSLFRIMCNNNKNDNDNNDNDNRSNN